MDRINLSIKRLENGWAELTLAADGKGKSFHFENVPNDPLYDLLESAVKVFDKRDSAIIFHNHSQKEHLYVKSLENGLCCVEYEGIRLNIGVKQFSRAILRMFDSYIFDFSRDLYSEHWGAYPEKDVEKLRKLYQVL